TFTFNVTDFLMTRNFAGDTGDRIVAFGKGILELDPTKQFLHSPPGTPGRPLASPASMLFSDRMIEVNGAPNVKMTVDTRDACSILATGFDPGAGPFLAGPVLYTGPFCATRADSFLLRIDLETGETTYTDSHCTATLELRCANGVLYGFSTETT